MIKKMYGLHNARGLPSFLRVDQTKIDRVHADIVIDALGKHANLPILPRADQLAAAKPYNLRVQNHYGKENPKAVSSSRFG